MNDQDIDPEGLIKALKTDPKGKASEDDASQYGSQGGPSVVERFEEEIAKVNGRETYPTSKIFTTSLANYVAIFRLNPNTIEIEGIHTKLEEGNLSPVEQLAANVSMDTIAVVDYKSPVTSGKYAEASGTVIRPKTPKTL